MPVGTEVIDDSLETIEGLYEYNHWIFNQLRPYVAGSVLEVGSGTGNITQFLSMCAQRVVGIEPVAPFAARFRERFGHMSHMACVEKYLHEISPPVETESYFDTVVSCNVLEHVEDDVNAVRDMAGQLRAGGRVVLFVPAGRLAFGKLDRELGHFRRYTLRSLRQTMETAGLVWECGHYSNVVGLVGWWFNSVVLRRRQVPAKQAALFNRLVPMLSAIERLLPLPCGQSVLGVARKPQSVVIELSHSIMTKRAA